MPTQHLCGGRRSELQPSYLHIKHSDPLRHISGPYKIILQANLTLSWLCCALSHKPCTVSPQWYSHSSFEVEMRAWRIPLDRCESRGLVPMKMAGSFALCWRFLAVSFRWESSCVFLHIDFLWQEGIRVICNSLLLLFLHLKALINLHPVLTSILSFGHKHLIFFNSTGHMNSNVLAGHINSNSFKNKLGILKGEGEHNIRRTEMHGL